MILRTRSVGIGFNPRSRRGSDLIALFVLQLLGVSIHAPAGGATFVRLGCHGQ